MSGKPCSRFTRRRIVAVLLLWAACVAPGLRAESGSTLNPRPAIVAAWRAHIEAARQKDLPAVMEIYADNVTYIIPGVQDARGKAALEKIEEGALNSADVVEATHTIDELRVYGDLAYELGTIVGPIRTADREPQTVTFHYMASWRLQGDGAWRIECMVGQPE